MKVTVKGTRNGLSVFSKVEGTKKPETGCLPQKLSAPPHLQLIRQSLSEECGLEVTGFPWVLLLSASTLSRPGVWSILGVNEELFFIHG